MYNGFKHNLVLKSKYNWKIFHEVSVTEHEIK